MSHFCLFVRRQDYVRAAYWLAKVENELPKAVKETITQQIIGATYKQPDYKALLRIIDNLVNMT